MDAFKMDAFKALRPGRVVFAAALLAALAMVFVSEGAYTRSVSTLDRLVAATQARASVLDLRKNILDAETGQRGYLLTGREEYLVPYRDAIEPINELFKSLEAHYSGRTQARLVLDELHERVNARLALISETVRLKQQGKPNLAAELELTGMGREQMDEIAQMGNELLRQSTMSAAESRKSIDSALRLARIGVMALTAISLVGLFIHLLRAAQADERQLELNRTIHAERDQLEVVVARRTAALTGLAQHLQTAREDERNRLARELHDELGALLTAAKLDAARIKPRLAGAAPEARDRLAHLVETLNASIALGRHIIEDLRPSTLANLGLVPALEILAREFAERSGVQVHCALAPVRLRPGAELMVYRLVQEAITNISKYARARQVWIELAAHEGQARVSVRDDGIGFDSGAQPDAGHGLLGMRYRVEAELGVLNVVSAPGQGTTVAASLPESA